MITSAADIRLIEKYENRTLITNGNADKDLIVYLPRPHHGRSYQVLQLSEFDITLHTNSDHIFFLTRKPSRRLRLKGTAKTVGKCLTIEAYQGKWRIVSTTFSDSQISFEE